MKELLKKTEALFDSVVEKNTELEGLVARNKELIDTNKLKRVELKSKEDSLKAREEKVKKIEDIAAFKLANEKKYFEVKKEMKELDIQRNAFVGYEKQIRTEHETKMNTLNANLKVCEERKQKYEDGMKKLKEDRKTMKEDLVKEISNFRV